MRRNVLILALVIVAIAAVWVWNDKYQVAKGDSEGKYSGQVVAGASAGDIPVKAAPIVNRYAPSFSLGSLDGTTTYEVGGKRDKVLIVNFWAAWCGPCELEAPDLKDIYAKHKDKLDFYAVNATKFDKVREAKDFVKEQELVFPILTDVKGDVGDLYKVYSYPTSFIIDRDGVIRQRIEGVISREDWEKYLKDVL
jgi:cytochrome c biogenesis protein CcmG, thiol:disulfide interchange protein DsbE